MCNSTSLLGILSIVKRIILLIQIFVPILLIVFAIISFIKLLQNPDKKDGHKKIINQILAAIIVFFIPVLVDAIMHLIDEKTTFSNCWNNASEKITIGTVYNDITGKEKKSVIQNANNYEPGKEMATMNYNNAVSIPNEALRNASHSNPSIVIVDDAGNVLASKDPNIRREGGSTTKVFSGFALVKLMDPEKDVVRGTQYAIDIIGEYNNHTLEVGQTFSISKAATYSFPDSSNSTANDIAIAIGRKYYTCYSDEDAFNKGMKAINDFYNKMGLVNTHLYNPSGLNGTNGHNDFFDDGMPKNGCKDGHTANDLAVVTIEAMKDKYFAAGINDRNNNGLFFIKSGTGRQGHGIWGFNYKNKRYYISILGINHVDNKYTVANDLYNWAKSRIK